MIVGVGNNRHAVGVSFTVEVYSIGGIELAMEMHNSRRLR